MSTVRAISPTWFGATSIYRAHVYLPPELCGRDNPCEERTVFFEADSRDEAFGTLEKLLALAWNVDTASWWDRGLIYNLEAGFDLLYGADRFTVGTDDLALFETGWGGTDGVGPERNVHYARAAKVELYVDPCKAVRLRLALARIEELYAAAATSAVRAAA